MTFIATMLLKHEAPKWNKQTLKHASTILVYIYIDHSSVPVCPVGLCLACLKRSTCSTLTYIPKNEDLAGGPTFRLHIPQKYTCFCAAVGNLSSN